MRISDWISDVYSSDLIAHRYTRSPLVQAFAALLVVTNVTLLGNAGMLVTNNLMPVPFASFGLYFFLRGVDHADPDWRSEERRGGNECGSTLSSCWSPKHDKKTRTERHLYVVLI